jgi:hypothetical protein
LGSWLLVSGAASLTIPGMETKEEGAGYEGVVSDLVGEHGTWWEEKLWGSGGLSQICIVQGRNEQVCIVCNVFLCSSGY